jgi:DNA-binding NarL/FixJ family response regulator
MDAQGRQPQADESLLAVLKETRANRLIRLIADEPLGYRRVWERLARTAPQTDRPWMRELALACARREARSSVAARPAAGRSPLSSREIQIVRLVAAGQSNKQSGAVALPHREYSREPPAPY